MPVHESLKQYATLLGFPQSPNLERVFELLYQNDEEIKLTAALPGTPDQLSKKLDMPEDKVKEIIERLINRGAITFKMLDQKTFRRFPAMIELRDASVLNPDAPDELFKVWDDLLMKETKPLIPVLKNLKIPPLVRVLPIERSVEAQNTVLDVDSARNIFKDAELISVIPCVCRDIAKRNGRGQDCPAPDDAVCMQTNAFANAVLDRGIGEKITNEEALRRVGIAEDAGLVHMVRNNIKDDMFMCNCCSCCCSGLHFVNNLGYLAGVAKSRFKLVYDADLCSSCGTCEDRCQFHALELDGDLQIKEELCYGCGNCVITCEEEALTLEEVRPVEHIRVK
jgi:NAD-dependent dihydropyrimidine dehydrogenase PreA subunit